MTLNQAILELTSIRDRLPPNEDPKICFGYDYGDRQHTIVTPEVEYIDTADVQYSEYHSELRLVDSEDDRGDTENVVVLRR